MKRTLLLCTFALLAFACDDDEESVQPELPVDAAVPPPVVTAPDSATPVEAKPIPLILWVDDLLDHHTNDSSPPDTVDDKNIYDDENPNTFDNRF